jgi:hypothetical protein
VTLRHSATLALFACCSLSLIACSDKPKVEHHYTLVEVIDVKGTCYEDHVRQPDGYAGQIVRWRDDETKQVSSHGYLKNTGNLVNRVLDETHHPTVYHTPFLIRFSDIQIDTNQPKWMSHGISDSEHGEGDEQGYDSTCELEVIKRGKELHSGSTISR